MLLRLRLNVQFVFLLLKLLNDIVVKMQRQRVRRSRRRQVGFLGNFLAQSAHCEQAQQKSGGRANQHDERADKHRVGESSHQSPRYQLMKSFPKNSATKAMLPRKTPNGIW